MLEIIMNEKRNILTPLNPRKTEFLGLVERITKNPFSDVYDEKREITMYFNVSGKPFVISEKQEFLNGSMLRVRHTSSDTNVKIKGKKERNGFKQINTRFLVPENTDFIVKEISRPELKNGKKMTVYGNEWFYFIKDDGFDNEKLFGIFLDDPINNGLKEVSNTEFENTIFI